MCSFSSTFPNLASLSQRFNKAISGSDMACEVVIKSLLLFRSGLTALVFIEILNGIHDLISSQDNFQLFDVPKRECRVGVFVFFQSPLLDKEVVNYVCAFFIGTVNLTSKLDGRNVIWRCTLSIKKSFAYFSTTVSLQTKPDLMRFHLMLAFTLIFF